MSEGVDVSVLFNIPIFENCVVVNMQHVTQRYKMSLAYMGTRYRGWQRQSPDRNDNSIQAVLEVQLVYFFANINSK